MLRSTARLTEHVIEPVAVLSPHLDDAVFSCGDLIAASGEAVVATVCAGMPPSAEKLTEWDAVCGFGSARHAITKRREEDRAALSALGAAPEWLAFCDAQYGEPVDRAQLRSTIVELLERSAAATVVVPLGLFHDDHLTAAGVALSLLRQFPDRHWIAYEDVPYRRIQGLVQRRLAALLQDRIVATPSRSPEPCSPLKRSAVLCYESQLRGLASPGRLGHLDALAPERYWALSIDGT
jgi:LmbE family N-acetylglucosaminyl deacetylase